ncbi:39S ribosomal protein L2, mitochondrial-like [Argonauta hians]
MIVSVLRQSLARSQQLLQHNGGVERPLLNFAKSAQVSLTQKNELHSSQPAFGVRKFIDKGIDISKYTMKPIPLPKSGGRGYDGRIQTHGVGGGHKKNYRMIDFKKDGPRSGPPLVEAVKCIRYDPCRSADIAVVASGEHKRFIIASQNMKVGDLIKTSRHIPRMTVRANEGDSYPLGALPIGSLVHNVEIYPDNYGKMARAAGTSAQLVRKVEDQCVIRLPSKREISVSKHCMATVGRVSNVDHNKEHIGSAQRSRWLGIRPQSGLWHRKTGYNGRKIRPIPPLKTYSKPKPPKPAIHKFSL